MLSRFIVVAPAPLCASVCFSTFLRFSIIIHFKLCLRHSKILLCVFGRPAEDRKHRMQHLGLHDDVMTKVWLALYNRNEPNPFLVQSECASFATRVLSSHQRSHDSVPLPPPAPSTHKRIIKFMNWMSVGRSRSQLGSCVCSCVWSEKRWLNELNNYKMCSTDGLEHWTLHDVCLGSCAMTNNAISVSSTWAGGGARCVYCHISLWDSSSYGCMRAMCRWNQHDVRARHAKIIVNDFRFSCEARTMRTADDRLNADGMGKRSGKLMDWSWFSGENWIVVWRKSRRDRECVFIANDFAATKHSKCETI